jgi:hypothetical protein
VVSASGPLGSLSRFSCPEPLLLFSSSSSVVLPYVTKLTHTETEGSFFKIVVVRVLSYVAIDVAEEPAVSTFTVEALE